MLGQETYNLRKDVDNLSNILQNNISFNIKTNIPAILISNNQFIESTLTCTLYIHDNGKIEKYNEAILQLSGSVNGKDYTLLKTVNDNADLSYGLNDTNFNYYKILAVDKALHELDMEIIPVIRGDSDSENINVLLGNDSQPISVTDEGVVTTMVVISIPVFVYRGVERVNAVIQEPTDLPTGWGCNIIRNPSITADGEIRLSIPIGTTIIYPTGHIQFNISKDNIDYPVIFTYHTVHISNDGVDGDSYQYIFKRTKNPIAPALPASDSDIIDISKGETSTLINAWTTAPIGVTHDFPYEWSSIRKYDGETKTWGLFINPALWAKYQYNGENGFKGNTGNKGIDGDNINPPIIKDNLTDEDLSGTAGNTLTDNITADYIFDDYDYQDIPVDSTYIDIAHNFSLKAHRVGRQIQLHYNFYVKISSITTNQYCTILDLPSWCEPILTPIYCQNILGPTNRMRINKENDKIVLQVWISNGQTGSANIAGDIHYLSCDLKKKGIASSILINQEQNPANVTVEQGQELSAQLIFNRSETYILPLYFKINGKLYKKNTKGGEDSTHSIYSASLNINLPAETYPSQSVWYDGCLYSMSEPEKMNGHVAETSSVFNLIVKKCNPVFNWGGSSDKAFLQITNSNGGYPLRNHDVTIIINGVNSVLNTDGEGKVYFNLQGYDNITVTAILEESNRSIGKTESHTFHFQSTGSYSVLLTPISVTQEGSGVDFTGLDIANIRRENDGLIIKSSSININSSSKELIINHEEINLPANTVINNIIISISYISSSDNPYNYPELTIPAIETYYNNTLKETINPSKNSISKIETGLPIKIIYTSTIHEIINKIKIKSTTNTGDTGRFNLDSVMIKIDYTIP